MEIASFPVEFKVVSRLKVAEALDFETSEGECKEGVKLVS